MTIKSKPMGDYQTNCYIVSTSAGDFIIDPGVGATSWVVQNVQNPLAILNTHGHFDHVWSNQEVKDALKLQIYCPKDDVFMLSNDIFGIGVPTSQVDIEVQQDERFEFGGVLVVFHYFGGHTPGCSAIEIIDKDEKKLFSGDFIFQGSIGRVDFPYSNKALMIASLQKILAWQEDMEVYAGHGAKTTLVRERRNLSSWIDYLS